MKPQENWWKVSDLSLWHMLNMWPGPFLGPLCLVASAIPCLWPFTLPLALPYIFGIGFYAFREGIWLTADDVVICQRVVPLEDPWKIWQYFTRVADGVLYEFEQWQLSQIGANWEIKPGRIPGLGIWTKSTVVVVGPGDAHAPPVITGGDPNLIVEVLLREKAKLDT